MSAPSTPGSSSGPPSQQQQDEPASSSPSSGSSSPSSCSSEPPSPQHETEYLKWHYNRYLKNYPVIPKISGDWSWKPYIMSLVAEELKFPQNSRLFRVPQCGSDPSGGSDSDSSDESEVSDCRHGPYSNGGVPDDESAPGEDEAAAKPPANLPAGQSGGSWNYLLYVPAWTDPNLASNLKPVYARQPLRYQNLPPRNLLKTMRPALRADDAALKPTAYALRWGIYPGRSDGRSRMTPPYVGTADYNKGINEYVLGTADEPMLNALRQETQARIKAGTTTYRGNGAAPEVVDEARRAHNVPGKEGLLQHAINSDLPFSRFVRNLPAGFNPEPYREMINDVLGDENYQRLLLGDYTTDELIRGGAYGLPGDLDQSLMNPEPLHELLVKERWETSASKGALRRWPRLIYEIDGRCNEWDVHNNDLLWSVLQPALQLVSKVLKSGPPFWGALKDMRTRAAIPVELDPRPVEDRATPRLIRIRSLEEALADGAVQDWPILYALVEKGLDYEKAVDYILRNTLKLGINSGYMSGGRSRSNFEYGRTSCSPDGPHSTIRIDISAEILWPLLVPNYTASEKLTTSFLVAVTLLHELMHATSNAVDFLLSENRKIWIPDVTPEMDFELKRWYDGNVDPDAALGEPWYGSDVHAELGWAFEHDLFGSVLCGISRDWQMLALSVLSLPFILASQMWPSDTHDTGHNNTLVDGRACRSGLAQEPVPIEFFAKFFTQAFWDDAVPTYGFRAFRRRNPDRRLLYSLPRENFTFRALDRLFGHENGTFFLFVLKTLRLFGYRLLLYWLSMTLVRTIAHDEVESVTRWREDIASWERSDEWWQQAIDGLDQAKASGDALWQVVSNLGPDAYNTWAAEWGPENPAGPCPAYGAWVQTAQQAFAGHFKEGGPFFTAVARLHDLALSAQGEMEFMVFEFLTLPQTQRHVHYEMAQDNPPDNNPIPMLLARLEQYRTPLQAAAAALDSLSTYDGFQTEPAQWSSRCQAVVRVLYHLDWLIRSHAERSDEENLSLRDHLRSVPSGTWEHPEVRLREVGLQEYQLVTPAIRAVIDEFDRRLCNGRRQPPPPAPPAQETMEEVVDVATEEDTM